MKKLFLGLSLLFLGSAAIAVEPNVRITSYTYINHERKVAELCGVVFNMHKVPTYVQVTVDYNGSRPAHYNTLVGADGRFCTVVVTYLGTAIARTF